MTGSAKQIRALLALGLAGALGFAACGSSVSSPSASPISSPGGTSSGAGSLVPGLSAGLDKLDSYQFSWTLATAVPDGSAASGSVPWVSGTVINKGIRSYRFDDPGAVQFIALGDTAWSSIDKGRTWTTADLSTVDLGTLLIGEGYATWFDKNAAGFKIAGEEPRNGVLCIRYKGDSSLSGLYSSVSGASGQFTADLWIAKDGNYPVAGSFGYSGPVGAKAGGFGFSFDVTHVNDPANAVVAPTNVLVEPTPTGT